MSNNGKKKRTHGGSRANSGRPRKVNPEDFVQVTCVLRRDTVEKLRAGAGGKHKFFGGFLQFHLDRFPIPTHEEYIAMKERKQLEKVVGAGPRRRRIPVIFAGNVSRARKPPVPRRRSEADEMREKFRKAFTPV